MYIRVPTPSAPDTPKIMELLVTGFRCNLKNDHRKGSVGPSPIFYFQNNPSRQNYYGATFSVFAERPLC